MGRLAAYPAAFVAAVALSGCGNSTGRAREAFVDQHLPPGILWNAEEMFVKAQRREAH